MYMSFCTIHEPPTTSIATHASSDGPYKNMNIYNSISKHVHIKL